MTDSYIKLTIAALLPVIASVIVYLLDKKTKFSKLSYKSKQIIIGVIFGLLAVVGTHWGIPVNDAQVNCRDAAVVSAGLLFGGPAGIIAGLIGGIERWFSVYLGVSAFTRVACSVSTIIAGIYSALLKKYMFEDKKPGWALAFAMGLVMETFHLTMVFITNMKTPIEAMAVVKACAAPMLIANSVSVLLATIFVEILAKEKLGFKYNELKISQTIQRWLLVTVVMAFVVTSFFVFRLQSELASAQTDKWLKLNLETVSDDIHDASDRNMLDIAEIVTKELSGRDLTYETLSQTAEKYDVAEINIVDKNGIIVKSNIKHYLNFNMASGKQSAEFLCLLGEAEEFVQKYGAISNDESTMRKYAGIKTDSGFIQVGYDGELFKREIDNQVVDITKNRKIGETGRILIFDKTHGIVSAPENFNGEGIDEEMRSKRPAENTVFEMMINGSPSYCCYMMTEGYYIFAVLPQEEALQMRNIALYVNAFLEILVFAALFGMIYLLIKRVVVNQISDINRSLAKITGGDLDVTVNVRSSTEFASLSDDINSTVSTLKRYICEAEARIDKELEFARNIQQSVLPSVYPAFSDNKEFNIAALMDTAKEVGGDFYDFYFTHKHKLNFVVADVSGKGIPAAMFMMRAKTELKRFTEANLPSGDIFTHSNEALCEGNDAGMFVTAWQAGIDLKTGETEFANAGHNPPLIKRRNGKFEYLRTKGGFILAGMEGMLYKTQSITLEKGDILFLYTDGVTEATNKNEKLYGEDRLLETINSKDFENMEELCKYIKADVDAFVGEADQFDDITMLAFRYDGPETA